METERTIHRINQTVGSLKKKKKKQDSETHKQIKLERDKDRENWLKVVRLDNKGGYPRSQ